MKKIPSLFVRDQVTKKVIDQVVVGSEWVLAGEGKATRKWDGLAVLVKGGQVFKRYDAKVGRTPPPTFMPAQPEPDPISGHWPGWVPANGPDGKREMEGIRWGSFNLFGGNPVPDGTYEVCGPTIGTRHGPNPENLTETILCIHGSDVLDSPRAFESIRTYLQGFAIEGIVWHHPDGRMVKIKSQDFE